MAIGNAQEYMIGIQMYDIVFVSYNEPTAETNWQILIDRFPMAKRVHGVKGIHQAHIEAAKKSFTKMVWIVDGDAEIMNDFTFDYQVDKWNLETVHVYRSTNPINNLIYGYGGVKLFPRHLTLAMDVNKPDMTTSISTNFKAMPQISNITTFNSTPFNTWKSAFRECCKLSSKVIDRQQDEETNKRLDVWCTVGHDQPFGEYAIQGARAGKQYGELNKNNRENLFKINDFEWLKEQFDAQN